MLVALFPVSWRIVSRFTYVRTTRVERHVRSLSYVYVAKLKFEATLKGHFASLRKVAASVILTVKCHIVSTFERRHPRLTGLKDEGKATREPCVHQLVDIGRFTWEDSHVGEFLQKVLGQLLRTNLRVFAANAITG